MQNSLSIIIPKELDHNCFLLNSFSSDLYSYRSKTEARMQAVAEAEVDILGTKSKDLDHYCFIIRPTAKKRNLIKAFIQVFVKPKHFPGIITPFDYFPVTIWIKSCHFKYQ